MLGFSTLCGALRLHGSFDFGEDLAKAHQSSRTTVVSLVDGRVQLRQLLAEALQPRHFLVLGWNRYEVIPFPLIARTVEEVPDGNYGVTKLFVVHLGLSCLKLSCTC